MANAAATVSSLNIRHFEMVSVAGLAPARLSLKGRMLGLLCIDGENKTHQTYGETLTGGPYSNKPCNLWLND